MSLQILQNDCLRASVCHPTGYNMLRSELHKTAKLNSVYQTWDKQLLIYLLIMYDKARRDNM